MEGIYPNFTKTCLSFLLLILLQTSAEALLCSGSTEAEFQEGNTPGLVITTLTVQSGVTLSFETPPPGDAFILRGNELIADKVFDLENGDEEFHPLRIVCTGPGAPVTHFILVRCLNINDNDPVFAETTFNRNLPEMSPLGTLLGPFQATDPDGSLIRYTLITPDRGFSLQGPTQPNLVVETLFEFDKVKNVQLMLRAEDAALIPSDPIRSATATININILDVDNRPPWFQPCTEHEISGALVCQNAGYTGRVVLNEQETGVLPLKPGPINAIDGDNGINEGIKYSFLGGDADGLFVISETTGGITMTRPADVLETISLTVLAAQRINTLQYSTTSVSISVQVKSLHPPKFQKTQYSGVISGVGSIAVDSTGEPLVILATDDDYETTGGLNPHVTYTITGSSDFSIVNGYLFMTEPLPDRTLTLQVVATDTSNDESATAQLSVEVTAGFTTSSPTTGTANTATTFTEEITTNSKTTALTSISPSLTTDSVSTAGDTTISTIPTSDPSITTSDPSMTSEAASTTCPPPVIIPSGGYGPEDMAALGATLGVLLFICIVTITVLALKLQRGKSDWRKIYETSMFRSTLGQGGGLKESMQYVNDAFVNDEDGGDPGSKGSDGETMKNLKDLIMEDAIQKSAALPPLGQGDDSSLAESDKTDDKEVKPILTKERRMDDGYKSVWFKEDIDPDAKEEVVIIPDSREEEEEEEEEEESEGDKEDDSEEENEDDNLQLKTPRVAFSDAADLDSGLGVKMGDPAEDSESGEVVTYDL